MVSRMSSDIRNRFTNVLTGRTMTDQEIITLLQGRDENALKLVYKEHYRKVVGYIVGRHSVSYIEGKDIFQDTVLALWVNAAKPDFKLTCKLSTYLISIARNVALKWIEKRDRLVLVDDHQAGISAYNTTQDTSDQTRIIEECISQLPAACQKVMRLFYFDELSNDQIAKVLNYKNADTVKTSKCKCLMKLKELMRSKYVVEDFVPEVVYS